MALLASLKDGQFVTNTASSESLSKAKEKNKSGMDSDAFLQLLVAEMQNQDPLEPTSNTDWVAQYATFTEVSEIQSIGNDMQAVKAQDLVGQYVIMKVTNAQGNTDYVSGQVDYVTYEEGKGYLSINGSLYSMDDLDTVASNQYMEAYDLASNVSEAYKKLPSLDHLTSSYKETVDYLYKTVSDMDDYQKSFVSKEMYESIGQYHDKMKEIMKELDKEEEE